MAMKRKASEFESDFGGPDESSEESGHYIGPFGAELVIIVAQYLSIKDTVSWAQCSKNLANLLLYEEGLWKLHATSTWLPNNISQIMFDELLRQEENSYKRLYKRLTLSRSGRVPIEKPLYAFSHEDAVFAEMCNPKGIFLGKLTFRYRVLGIDNKPRGTFVISAVNYTTGKVIRTWDLSEQLLNEEFNYHPEFDTFVNNNRFISVKVILPERSTGDYIEDTCPGGLFVFDVETGKMIKIYLEEPGDQPQILRGTNIWTTGKTGLSAPSDDKPIEYYIKAYSVFDGTVTFSAPVPKPEEGTFLDNQYKMMFDCIDDTHMVYQETLNTFCLYEIKTCTRVATFFSDMKDWLEDVSLMLTEDMFIAYNELILVVWFRPSEPKTMAIRPVVENSYEEIAKMNNIPVKKHRLTWLQPRGPQSLLLCVDKLTTVILSVPKIRAFCPTATFFPLKYFEENHRNSQMSCLVSDFMIVYYLKRREIAAWNITGKDTRFPVIEWKFDNIQKHIDNEYIEYIAYFFVDGPYLVLQDRGLLVWDLSGGTSIEEVKD